jgi:hypothetical protein
MGEAVAGRRQGEVGADVHQRTDLDGKAGLLDELARHGAGR